MRRRPRKDLSAAESDLKYKSGQGARVPPSARPLSVLEWVTLAHVVILLGGITWAFGGGAEWMRPAFAWWGSLGFLITLTAVWDHAAWREGWNRPLMWLWPIGLFNLLVLGAALNPSFREVHIGSETVFENRGGHSGFPSSAQPALALTALWYFDALWIAAFNLTLVIRQRRALRGLLLVAAINALALSIFGTVQKLSHATGPYFGLVKTRQTYFFGPFIYHNHWGAFTLLMLSACLGLAWHYARRVESRDFLHSPAFGALVAIFFIAATIPLSGSRSSTMLATMLFGGAFVHWIARLIRNRRRMRESVVLPVAGAFLVAALAVAGVWYIAQETIHTRAVLTENQVQAMLDRGGIGSRSVLYHDTWSMAKAKVWFGWGMGSYPHVFTLFNSQVSADRLPVFYHDAHSDWLQAFAEHGLVGSSLLALAVIVPLLRLRRRHLTSTVPSYLLLGCGLILLYAWVEFPFGNLAVVLAWWICFYGAIQYARLQDREALSPVKLLPYSAAADAAGG